VTTTDSPPTSGFHAAPIDDGDLATWVERRIFDDHTPPEVAAQVLPQTEAHPLNGWRPADDSQAEWAMARLARLVAEIDRINREHDDWAENVEASRRGATRSLEYRARFFRDALTGYAIVWRDAAPDDRGTLHLPSGTVATTVPRKATIQLEPARSGELVAWLQAQDAERVEQAKALKVVEPEPMIGGVRKLVEARQVGDEWRVVDPGTGEVVPGLVAYPPGDTTASVKPNPPSPR
jgi:hypothetical protein